MYLQYFRVTLPESHYEYLPRVRAEPTHVDQLVRNQHGPLWSITSEGLSQLVRRSGHRKGGGAGGVVIIYRASVFSLYVFLRAAFLNVCEIPQIKKLEEKTSAIYHLNISETE